MSGQQQIEVGDHEPPRSKRNQPQSRRKESGKEDKAGSRQLQEQAPANREPVQKPVTEVTDGQA